MNPLLKPQFLNSSTVNKDCNANLIANIYYHTAMYESYPLTFRLEKLGNFEEEKLARASYSTFLPLLPPPPVFNFLLVWRVGPTFSATQETMPVEECSLQKGIGE